MENSSGPEAPSESPSSARTPPTADRLAALAKPERLALWVGLIDELAIETMLEIGVWRGAFAQELLTNCPSLRKYYMLDPWRHLPNWNKPFNVPQPDFDAIYDEAMRRTEFAVDRRVVLRGRTCDVIDEIPDGSLDLVYIDGDHTLRGIAIDMMRALPKLKVGGVLGGDDYSPTIWQHPETFEPSLVCPFAAYFAESLGAPLIVFEKNQYALVKPDGIGEGYRVIDTTRRYGEPVLGPQVRPRE